MTDIKIDLSKDGLEMVFTDYMATILRHIWGTGKTVNSAQMHALQLEKEHGRSRASIINGLNHLVDLGVLSYHEETCKGGSRRLYETGMTEAEFWSRLGDEVVDKIMAARKEL